MQVIAGNGPVPEGCRGGVIAIGNFDGVHRGHQTLLARAEAEAKRLGRPWGAVTFEPHPRSYFRPEEPVFRLTPEALKARLVAALGASFMAVLPFDRARTSRSTPWRALARRASLANSSSEGLGDFPTMGGAVSPVTGGAVPPVTDGADPVPPVVEGVVPPPVATGSVAISRSMP